MSTPLVTGRVCTTHCLRRLHESRYHGQRTPAKPPGPGDFDRHVHGVDGMPTCSRFCRHPFCKWCNLRKHIERRQCPSLQPHVNAPLLEPSRNPRLSPRGAGCQSHWWCHSHPVGSASCCRRPAPSGAASNHSVASVTVRLARFVALHRVAARVATSPSIVQTMVHGPCCSQMPYDTTAF